MTLFLSDPFELDSPDFVRVLDTVVGKGVFAVRPYPATAVIGKITGNLILDENYGSEYTYEYQEGIQLEPLAPFRFINHSCEPNCEFDLLEENEFKDDERPSSNLYLVAIQDIRPEDELTIDYNWPATSAIPCMCGAESCRGWVVAESELEKVEPY